MNHRMTFFEDRDSPLHRLNPLTKLLIVMTNIAVAFISPWYWTATLMFVLVVIPLSLWGRITQSFLKALLRLLLPAVVFLFVMQSFFYPGGQHDNRHTGFPPQRPADVQSVQARQQQVQHNQVGAATPGFSQAGDAIPGAEHAKAGVLQVIARQLNNARLIVYDQDQLIHGFIVTRNDLILMLGTIFESPVLKIFFPWRRLYGEVGEGLGLDSLK